MRTCHSYYKTLSSECDVFATMPGKTEAALASLGISLVSMPKPLAAYVPYTRTGNLIFTAGHIPFNEDMKTLPNGKLG